MTNSNMTLDPALFARAIANLRPSKSIEGARLMLVEGLTCKAAAGVVGTSHQTVTRARRMVIEILNSKRACPLCKRKFEK